MWFYTVHTERASDDTTRVTQMGTFTIGLSTDNDVSDINLTPIGKIIIEHMHA